MAFVVLALAATSFSQIPSALGWSELPNTMMRFVCEDGDNTCGAVVGAWNSGAFDTKRNRLIIWGGGHSDYYGNEIYALNLNGTPNFERLNKSTAGGCSMESCDGGITPNSRHTYDGIEYMPNVDRMFVKGGSMAGVGWCQSNCEPSTWTFNFVSMAWKAMVPSTSPVTDYGSLSGYDPNTGRVIFNDLRNLYAYNCTADAYTLLGSASGNVGYHACGAVDPKRKKFVTFGGGEAGIYDISGTGSADRQTFNTTGGSAIVNGSYPGLAYDPVRDRMTAYIGGNTVYVLNMDTKVWTTVSSAGTPGSATSTGTYGRWNYSPDLDVFVIVNSVTSNAWIYRFPPTDTTRPTAPGNLAGSALSDNAGRLTWTAASDAESAIREYIVKRAGVEVGRTSSLAYNDSGLTESTQYSYTVIAVNGAGLQSATAAGPVTVTTSADAVSPSVIQVTVIPSGTMTIIFSEVVEASSATNMANYAVNKGVAVQSASLSSDGETATLSTSGLVPGDYTLTINNVRDRSIAHNTIAANSQVNFTFSLAPIIIGEPNVLPTDDNGNGNMLFAQAATLSQTATLQSLSFYVTSAAGKLRLGVYDATGPGAGPGAKRAETAEMTPVTGWNTAAVVTPISLSAGNYWLAYLPSDNGLAFKKTASSTINSRSYACTYGAMPSTYSTSPNTTPSHWSFYATFNGSGSLVTPVPLIAARRSVPSTCAIYNLRGQVVRVVKGFIDPGRPDFSGYERGLSNGLYLFKISNPYECYVLKRLKLGR